MALSSVGPIGGRGVGAAKSTEGFGAAGGEVVEDPFGDGCEVLGIVVRRVDIRAWGCTGVLVHPLPPMGLARVRSVVRVFFVF
jgi:hypothetical protein